MKFKKGDIGKLVQLYLDTEKHRIARILGASEVLVVGRVLEISKRYVKIKKLNVWTNYDRSSIVKIPYDTIKCFKYYKVDI